MIWVGKQEGVQVLYYKGTGMQTHAEESVYGRSGTTAREDRPQANRGWQLAAGSLYGLRCLSTYMPIWYSFLMLRLARCLVFENSSQSIAN